MFSLCIPTMDRINFLKTYLPKYINNKHVNEIIICDENGNDCREISRIFQSPKLKLHINEKKLGPFLNKIKCCRLASSEWIALIDSDNFADEKYFESAINFIQLNNCNDKTILAPSFAKPNFDFRVFAGMTYKKGLFDQNREKEKKILGKTTWSETVMNTGNYIIHRNLTNNLNIQDNINIINSSSACDVILMNTMFFQQFDAEMHIVKDMEYEHVVHNGSIYINTHGNTRSTISFVHNEYRKMK